MKGPTAHQDTAAAEHAADKHRAAADFGSAGWGRHSGLVALQGAVGNRVVGRLIAENGDRYGRGSASGNPGLGKVPVGGAATVHRVQRRRVPSMDMWGGASGLLTEHLFGAGDLLATQPVDATSFAAHAAGLRMVLDRAIAGHGLSIAAVQTHARGERSQGEFDLLPERDRLRLEAQAIQELVPASVLGDPALIDVGARAGSNDAANIQSLVTSANAIFDAIANGTHDAWLGQVFGAGNVGTAKAKYAAAKTWLNNLHGVDKIVTDRSGFSPEVNLGGLTGYHTQISLAAAAIDNPTAHDSIVTTVHESMHAGNQDVRDYGYIHQNSFTVLPEAVKLNNAAHYEVVPRRIKGAAFAFVGQTFLPAGVGGAPALTATEQALRDASETVRQAWTAALNLHQVFVGIFKHRNWWIHDFGGGVTYAASMPYWSKVEKLTMHQRTAAIDPTLGGKPSTAPVTLIDIALSEGLTRKLAHAMATMPAGEAAARDFEFANSTSLERMDVFLRTGGDPVARERDFLISLVMKVIGPATGSVERDLRVIHRLALANRDPNWFTHITTPLSPDTFPD